MWDPGTSNKNVGGVLILYSGYSNLKQERRNKRVRTLWLRSYVRGVRLTKPLCPRVVYDGRNVGRTLVCDPGTIPVSLEVRYGNSRFIRTKVNTHTYIYTYTQHIHICGTYTPPVCTCGGFGDSSFPYYGTTSLSEITEVLNGVHVSQRRVFLSKKVLVDVETGYLHPHSSFQTGKVDLFLIETTLCKWDFEGPSTRFRDGPCVVPI